MRRAVLGVLLVAVGALWLLDAADVITAGNVLADWWPVALIVIGVSQLGERGRTSAGGPTLVVFGVVALGFTTGVVSGDAVNYAWPIGLIALGLWIVVSRAVGRTPPPLTGDVVDEMVLFSAKDLHVASDDWRGGRAVAVFGGIDLDLRMVQLHPEGALLEIVGVFGGVDVKVPRGWRVEMRGPAVFGGWENKSLPAEDGAPMLLVKAVAVFGGVTVTGDPAVTAADLPQTPTTIG